MKVETDLEIDPNWLAMFELYSGSIECRQSQRGFRRDLGVVSLVGRYKRIYCGYVYGEYVDLVFPLCNERIDLIQKHGAKRLETLGWEGSQMVTFLDQMPRQ